MEKISLASGNFRCNLCCMKNTVLPSLSLLIAYHSNDDVSDSYDAVPHLCDVDRMERTKIPPIILA